MAWYRFITRSADGRRTDVGMTNLSDHTAARRYAKYIIRELKERLDHRDPAVNMIVQDSDGEVIHVIPFQSDSPDEV